ncbi:MAG TPA: hypothetical protein VN151_12265 [Terracidiphilus sp.]|nr:hypothetical protein [Terracidiphilus sp.]
MENTLSSRLKSSPGPIAVSVAAALIACAGIVFGVREHNSALTADTQRQTLADQNKQMTAQLSTTQNQLDAIAQKVNALSAANQPATAEAGRSGTAPGGRHAGATRHGAVSDSRFTKMQTQIDAQGKLLDAQRSDIDSTRTDLATARTELTGSIARTHDELVVLQKKGERNYVEFDITKSKEFKREGPINISLRKANTKRGYADLALIVEDRNLTQKHVNLYQPAMFYTSDAVQPIEIVINDISKDHIHGYVSAPKYRKSELVAANDALANPDQAAGTAAQPAPRQKLPLPGSKPDQQQ